MRDSANVFGSFLNSVQGVGEKSVQRAVDSVVSSFSNFSSTPAIANIVNQLGREKLQNEDKISTILKIIDQDGEPVTVASLMKGTSFSIDAIVSALKSSQESGLLTAVVLPDESRYYRLTAVGKSVVDMLKQNGQ